MLGLGNIATLVVCLRSWVLSPALQKLAWWYTLIISAFRKWRQEDQKGKVIFSYNRLRGAWAT